MHTFFLCYIFITLIRCQYVGNSSLKSPQWFPKRLLNLILGSFSSSCLLGKSVHFFHHHLHFIGMKSKLNGTRRSQPQRKRNLLQMRIRKWQKLWTTSVLQQKLIRAVLKLAQLQNYHLHTSTHDMTTSSLCLNWSPTSLESS